MRGPESIGVAISIEVEKEENERDGTDPDPDSSLSHPLFNPALTEAVMN
jgi:hypothetical protein